MQEVWKPDVYDIDLGVSTQSLYPVISVMLLANSPMVGKWLDLRLRRRACSDNLHFRDPPEGRHMIHIVDEAAADHTYFDLLHQSESSRVLTGFSHI
jgi:hypothetical protein